AATGDVDVLFYLIHSMSAGTHFEDLDRRAAAPLAPAGGAAAGGRLGYLGGLHPYGRLSRHLRSRTEVGEILADSGVPTFTLQAGVVIGSGSASFE
ncbi:NADH-binding protein, partial [Acinetobacter baumannii]